MSIDLPRLAVRSLAISVAVIALISCGDSPTEPPPANTVTIADNSFSPETLAVAVGTRVRWFNNGGEVHDVTQYDGEFTSEAIAPGESFSAELTEPGLFEYACTRHPGMQGAVLVQ
jgi:plastocyanin